MICAKGHVEANRDKGQAFQTEWASDCRPTRCLLFCFLNYAGSVPCCDLRRNGVSATCGPRKTLESYQREAGCFQKSMSTSKSQRGGGPLHLPDSMAVEKVREVIAHSPGPEPSENLHKGGFSVRASSLAFLYHRPGTFFLKINFCL